MTIASTTRRWQYTGNGVTTAFAYAARITDKTHLLVTVTDTSGVTTTQVITTDYTVSNVGQDAGGNVTLVVAPASAYIVTIAIVVPVTQETRLRNQTSYFQETHEELADYELRIDQQQQKDIDGSLKLNAIDESSDFDMEIPATVVGQISKAIVTNAAGDGIATPANWPSAADISSAAASAAAAASSAGMKNPYLLNNVGLTANAGPDLGGPEPLDNTLVIRLKQSDGSTDPATGTGIVGAWFRSSTLPTGSITSRTVSAALSLIIPNTATMGLQSGVDGFLYVYLIDNAGTLELAVAASNQFDEGGLVSTTAISVGSDSATVMYSTTARTNVAFRLIGRMISNQAATGVWAVAATAIKIGILQKVLNNSEVWVDTPSGYGSTNDKIRIYDNIRTNVGSAITYETTAAAGNSFTINENGLYTINVSDGAAAASASAGVSVNSNQLTTEIFNISYANGFRGYDENENSRQTSFSVTLRLNIGDVVRSHQDGDATNTNSNSFFHIIKIGD